MDIKRIAKSGSLVSCDVLVTIKPNKSGRKVILESDVKEQFGEDIKETVNKVLDEFKVENLIIRIQDKGALDFVIRSRVETAIKRASNNTNKESGN
ncbi:MAG: citrate lyase acyl carrier protein [Halanaerobiales bacterium]